jgi:uncharacterized protein
MTDAISDVQPPERFFYPEEEPFWAAIDDGEFVLVKCVNCGARSALARSCVQCASTDFEWSTASRSGTIISFSVFHRALHPFFADKIPYNVVLVRLDDGPELFMNVRGVQASDLRIGMRVGIQARRLGDTFIPQADLAES